MTLPSNRFAFNAGFSFLIAVGMASSIVSLSGCSGKPIDENDPAALYKEAQEEINSDHYQLAIDKLRIIKNKFPYSKYSTDAQLKIADVYFLQESFTEAALAYESFRDLHPRHEKVGYAMFRVGKSYFNDAPGNVARDMTPATKSLDAYNDFIKKFPTAPESDEARKDIASLRKTLAQKELYIANFYFKRDFYLSAKNRYTKLLELFPETDPAKEAKDKLEAVTQKLAQEAEKK